MNRGEKRGLLPGRIYSEIARLKCYDTACGSRQMLRLFQSFQQQLPAKQQEPEFQKRERKKTTTQIYIFVGNESDENVKGGITPYNPFLLFILLIKSSFGAKSSIWLMSTSLWKILFVPVAFEVSSKKVITHHKPVKWHGHSIYFQAVVQNSIRKSWLRRCARHPHSNPHGWYV